MTSAIFSRTTSHRRMRVAAAAATLAGVLALTACSGDGGSDDDSSPSTGASTATADTGGGSGGSASSSASASASDELAGSWLATTKGKAVVLMVNGTEAGLFATGGTICSGTAGEQDGMRMIRLTCTDGSKDRQTGMVDSVSKTGLKVTWEGGLGTETYTRSEGGQLPSGLPTASLG
ncbi:hypothetical protein QF037_004362 [Streptomyces canus]|uniref:hypothetical protein n=1 Tax=Streptomyces canus TaxID=58343 RepID=UPI002787A79A|nr:hypothetical protein [Streptomyces canus]MDQ0600017.1 hypothetical protein [Streptomyces canus]